MKVRVVKTGEFEGADVFCPLLICEICDLPVEIDDGHVIWWAMFVNAHLGPGDHLTEPVVTHRGACDRTYEKGRPPEYITQWWPLSNWHEWLRDV